MWRRYFVVVQLLHHVFTSTVVCKSLVIQVCLFGHGFLNELSLMPPLHRSWLDPIFFGFLLVFSVVNSKVEWRFRVLHVSWPFSHFTLFGDCNGISVVWSGKHFWFHFLLSVGLISVLFIVCLSGYSRYSTPWRSWNSVVSPRSTCLCAFEIHVSQNESSCSAKGYSWVTQQNKRQVVCFHREPRCLYRSM